MASWVELPMRSVDVVFVIRVFFVGSAGIGILLGLTPVLRRRYMDYGIRTQSQRKSESKPLGVATSTTVGRWIDALLTFEVPHRFFLHYYVLSVASSVFWGYQLWYGGWAVRLLSQVNAEHRRLDGMSAEQVWLCWALMAVQGLRRLAESIAFVKPTQAKMPLPIYAIGLAFYLVTNVAVWVEGLDSVLSGKNRQLRPWHETLSASRSRLAGFLLDSLLQLVCHRHLASLRKYSLPTHYLFTYMVCPHYAMECAIYLALARIAAPAGSHFNLTLLSVLGFVVINLGVVAHSTREWWRLKFGNAAASQRWRMIPPIW